MNIDRKGLQFKMWSYFIIFSATIMIILWFLQIVFLNSFYNRMKTTEIEDIGNQLVEEYGSDNFTEILTTTSLQEGIAIHILDEQGNLLYPLENILEIINQPRLEFESFVIFLNNLFQSDDNYVVYTREDPRVSNPTLVYGAILENQTSSNYFLYINSVLEPVDSTVKVLQSQLIIVTVISLILSIGISYIISKRIIRPIINITDSAYKLGKGQLDATFNKGDYTEIDNLVDTLNITSLELQKTDELRRDLIANVSHDLKTPLTVIRSYGEMIRDISGDKKEKRDKHIETIIEETDKLSHLVNDMLDLSKMEAGLYELKIEDFDIKELTENILERFSYFIDKEGYYFQINSVEDPIVKGDKEKIEQAIYNLISNAINYSKENKEIIINIRGEENRTRFEVVDNGPGIPPDEIYFIWDRYYRVGKDHKRTNVGSGIGLSIVKTILESHNSSFGVDSQVGKGSTFYFSLERDMQVK